ncbi:hypothetical protein [Allostreptomyces psammosilenae]|uniref:YtxH domain-containing protein n=1 Tax=Allostreptomyces psammosilenae TaxID=1892865 RepID=A0A852ZWF5_9ACTN|nr:hypothetical protein [Allostreptomyces psammosilenae]NYI06706.1 hypothetical protein [Allostreptomyces psammosilenae]
MRYRLAFLGGLAAGYVLGARAGRERYDQIARTLRSLRERPAVQRAGRTAVDAGVQAAGRVAGTVNERWGDRLPAGVGARLEDTLGNLRGRTARERDWGSGDWDGAGATGWPDSAQDVRGSA